MAAQRSAAHGRPRLRVEWWLSSGMTRALFSTVGRPIPVQQILNPTSEQIEELHQTYLEELKKLFNEHKGKYGIPEHETLVFK